MGHLERDEALGEWGSAAPIPWEFGWRRTPGMGDRLTPVPWEFGWRRTPGMGDRLTPVPWSSAGAELPGWGTRWRRSLGVRLAQNSRPRKSAGVVPGRGELLT